MTNRSPGTQPGTLLAQLRWFIRLRWVAGLAVVAGALCDVAGLHWFQHGFVIGSVGVSVLLYNLILLVVLHRLEREPTLPRHRTLLFAWAQLLLDLACLTLLTVWTGGLISPIATFFVFHMVFASLLLPRRMAYASGISAILMLSVGMWLTNQFPADRGGRLLFAGRACTLIFTVYLANHITRDLRRQRRSLIRQNIRVNKLAKKLKRHQQALVQQEKMVAMGQMAAGVTHEIANPLASMDSLLQLMQRKPERLRPDAIQTLRDQVQRINQIIQQMKSFAHPVETQQQTIAVNDVIDAAVDMLRFDKRMKTVKIEKQLSPDVGQLSFMPQALQQVLVNLIVNALDAVSETPSPAIVVRSERRESHVLIEVADNGSGISEEHMARLFEPFFTTKPLGKGTGLGLSISYTLIQKQGGHITARSEVGKGTTFTVRLPAPHHSRTREAPPPALAGSENRLP